MAGAWVGQAGAADVLIQNATVHTASSAGTLTDTDVLIHNGRIAAIGKDLVAANAEIVDAKGKPLSPGLFGGVNALGIEDVSLEIGTVDSAYTPSATVPAGEQEYRPEFNVADAYNPESVVIPVQRVEGVTFDVVAPNSLPGGTLFSGLGGAALLDGRSQFLSNSETLFIAFGTGASPLTGNSRAAQLMLLREAFVEAKAPAVTDNGLLTAQGRATLRRYADGGRVAFNVNRAIDISRVLDFAKTQGIKPVIIGGIESWQLRDRLAAEKVTVVLDPLVNLPNDFDSLGASLETANWLNQAGVPLAFYLSGDAAHNARKVRQAAGNAVAHGLDWQAGLRAITSVPARTFGITDRGEIAVGQFADLVLWTGDPLEVTTLAETVWIEGKAQSPRTHQTELRDRYKR
ncbi:amidohydrolase [Ahniella affigens]|uniref:Amidohydrolase n=1 Tax=Ahniella affigens TaxID=2021234 RepID=A0A2P1PZG8_9GAMM|nr:amidohydrolase [Ahniella affigens]